MEHKEGDFKGVKNLTLHYQVWLPSQPPFAVLLVLHGLAEHSGRYRNLVEYFVPKGYAVYSFDHRGHGRSAGMRCYTDRFSDYLDDLRSFDLIVRGLHPGKKLFMAGHSIGGTIATVYAIRYQSELNGLILSSPTLKPGASITRSQIVMARVVSVLLPKMGVASLDSTGLSRDKAVVEAYDNDPLVYRGKVCARLGAELINVMEKYLPGKMAELELPLLIMQGTADRLSNPEGSATLYNVAKSKDKTLKHYEGFYHEIFNEPGREQVFADMEAWLTRHL